MEFEKYGKKNFRMARLPDKTSGSIAALVLSLSLLMDGCAALKMRAARENAEALATDLQIYVDWSISAENESMMDFAQSFTNKLPELVEQYSVTNCTAFQFGSDGWAPAKIVSLDLPPLRQADVGEAGELIGKLKEQKQAEMLNQYRAQVRERLSGISAASLVPAANMPAAPCTDLNGVFRRIASTHSKHRQIVVVVTDGHESCNHTLRAVKAALAAIGLVIVLLPEKPQGNVSKLKYKQFEQRSAEITQALSWAVVVPPFEDLRAAIGEALVKPADEKPVK